jgi:hypothetical protein
MKVKIVNPDTAAGLIDPHTKRSPFIDATTGETILGPVDVPENNHWVRRIIAGEIERAESTPTGSEPIAPLTTRSVRR